GRKGRKGSWDSPETMRWTRRATPELSLSPILVAQVGDVGGVANAGCTSHEAVTLITRSCNGRKAGGCRAKPSSNRDSFRRPVLQQPGRGTRYRPTGTSPCDGSCCGPAVTAGCMMFLTTYSEAGPDARICNFF